jgi:sulfite exporter TauE/SafE
MDWVDVVLIASLGFLGSFGHCLGMCGPITVALSLGTPSLSPAPAGNSCGSISC